MNWIIFVAVLICQSITHQAEGFLNKLSAQSHDHMLSNNETNHLNMKDKLKLINMSEDGLMDFKGLANKYIGDAEEWDIETEDGYILKVFHIPGNISKTMLLSHGFLGSSDNFMVRGNRSWIYALAKEDYDIWAINYRGNRYSKRHKTLIPDINPQFWEYSMQELGYYDLRAVIDFILDYNGIQKLSIIGHSEGCAAVFVLISQIPEYNNKVKVFIALSPGCYITYGGQALRTVIETGNIIADTLKILNINEFFGYNSLSHNLFKVICSQGESGYELCVDGIVAAFSGPNSENLEPEFLLTILGHFPAGSSVKNARHYVQIGKSKRFAQYDYGVANIDVYGSEQPPLYDLKKVSCDVAVVGAHNDLLVSLKDVERVKDELPNVVDYFIVSNKKFTHADYIWGYDAVKVLYPHVLDILSKYN